MVKVLTDGGFLLIFEQKKKLKIGLQAIETTEKRSLSYEQDIQKTKIG